MASLALTYHVADRPVEAVETYQTALELFVSLKDRTNVAKTLANLGLTSQDAGDLDGALAYLDQAVAEYREIRDGHGEALALVNRVRILRKRGDADEEVASAAAEAAAVCSVHGYADQLERLAEFAEPSGPSGPQPEAPEVSPPVS